MSRDSSLLPREAVALVHHIELNRAGWWEKTVDRLVLAAVWLSEKPPTVDEIRASLDTTFSLPLGEQRLAKTLAALESRQVLLVLPGGTYRIPEQARRVFEQEIAASEQVESEAKAAFGRFASELQSDLSPTVVWDAFQTQFLAPLVREVGANAYHWLAGEKLSVDKSRVDSFLKPFPSASHAPLRRLVTAFLDPKVAEARAYVSRLLHAQFCVDAGGLSEDVLAKLNASLGRQVQFRLFVDTNFLFSLLALHENPSNAAASELRQLIGKLQANPKIQLLVTPETISEAKNSIAHTKGRLKGLPVGQNFLEAALHSGISGMALKFLSERKQRPGLTVDEWFDQYLNDFVAIARSKGVELFNDKMEGYATRQDVIDDIMDLLKYEQLRDARRKSYATVEHDMVLWHFANDKRAAYVESPIEAVFWILTVDFRFIGFDEHKQRILKSKVPLCIHPSSLIQLLQFWVPRSKDFEEAMLGSLRLPFLFQDFDAAAERTSLKILKGIGRYAGDDLPVEAIAQVMVNEDLRARLNGKPHDEADEAEVALIRDALVEEMRLRGEAGAARAKSLEDEIARRDRDLAALADANRLLEANAEQSRKQLEDGRTESAKDLTTRAAELSSLQSRLRSIEEATALQAKAEVERRQTRTALLLYLVGLLIAAGLSVGLAWWVAREVPTYTRILGGIPARVLVALPAFVACHLVVERSLGRKPLVAALWPFRQVRRFRQWLWGVVCLGFVLGLAGNLYANYVQKGLDAAERLGPGTLIPASERK